MALYVADDGVTPVTTQSMIKAFRSCHREALYKYHERLSPKVASTPLTRGKWVHSLLEDHYNGEDWKPTHEKMKLQFSKLFDEEKEKLGDLPNEIGMLMKSYFWHYGDPEVEGTEWNVLEVELLLEHLMPNGHLFRGKFDMLVEIDGRLWLVDHKTHKKFPEWAYRMFDEQSTMYTWLARKCGIPVEGFIWNYINTSGFPKYNVLKDGSNFYKKSLDGDSTYPALVAAVKKAQKEFPDTFLKDPKDRRAVKARLQQLKDERWQGPNDMPRSPFFRRDFLSKDDDLIERTLKSVMRTSEAMHSYDFSDPDAVERDINQCKGFMCNFKDLSLADLVQGDSELLKKRNYKKSDPLAYHNGNDNLKDE